MAKPKYRDIKIQRDGRFNTNGTVHETIEEAFAYWDKKLPNSNITNLIYPSTINSELGAKIDLVISCFSLEYAKRILG